MSQPLLRPSFTADISSLDRRVGNLERRTTPRPVSAASNTASGAPIGSNLFVQRSLNIDNATFTSVYFVSDDILIDNSPSPFWTLTADAPATYEPGVYSVQSMLAFDVPSTGATGKTLSWDTYGLIHRHTMGDDLAGDNFSINGIEIAVTPTPSDFSFWGLSGGDRLRIYHEFGATVGMFVGLYVIKIGYA